MSVAVAFGPLDDAEITQLHRRIIFFDGICGFCNASVDFVLSRDREEKFRFAPLQGETARQILAPKDTQNLHTLVLWVDDKTYRRTAAVVRILWQLGWSWRILAALLWLIPWPLRDLGYLLVARNRYRLFGRKDTCRMPTPAERARFLP